MTPAYETYDPVASVTSKVKTQLRNFSWFNSWFTNKDARKSLSYAVIIHTWHYALENEKKRENLKEYKCLSVMVCNKSKEHSISNAIFKLFNRPRSIYQYSSMAPRLSGKNCKFFKVLLSLNSQRRLRYKENNTKYRSLTWKPRSHVRILIYRTWPINLLPRRGQRRWYSLTYSECLWMAFMTTSIWQVSANIVDINYPLGFIYDSFIERLLIFMQTAIVLSADGRNGTI